MPFKSITEQILVKHSVGWKSFPILIPPDACRTLQLMSGILRLQTFSQPKQAELLFHRVQPFLSLKRFFSFSERWGFVSMKSLKLLYWLGSGPSCALWPPWFAIRLMVSVSILWLSTIICINSAGFVGGGGGGGFMFARCSAPRVPRDICKDIVSEHVKICRRRTYIYAWKYSRK